jgi:hypothetical protein
VHEGGEPAADLAAIGALLEGIDDRIQLASRRVAEADGRLDRELSLLREDLAQAVQSLRDDFAAATAAMLAEISERLDGR